MGWIVFTSLVVAIVAIWIAWLIAKEFYAAANVKGYYEEKYLWICFFLGVIGYLLVVALPDRGNAAKSVSNELPDL